MDVVAIPSTNVAAVSISPAKCPIDLATASGQTFSDIRCFLRWRLLPRIQFGRALCRRLGGPGAWPRVMMAVSQPTPMAAAPSYTAPSKVRAPLAMLYGSNYTTADGLVYTEANPPASISSLTTFLVLPQALPLLPAAPTISNVITWTTGTPPAVVQPKPAIIFGYLLMISISATPPSPPSPPPPLRILILWRLPGRRIITMSPPITFTETVPQLRLIASSMVLRPLRPTSRPTETPISIALTWADTATNATGYNVWAHHILRIVLSQTHLSKSSVPFSSQRHVLE